jgi:hypothetical protein
VFKGLKVKVEKRAELRLLYRKNDKVLIKVIIKGLKVKDDGVKKLFFLGVLEFKLLILLLEYLLFSITFPMPFSSVVLKLSPT